eukprot:527794_1
MLTELSRFTVFDIAKFDTNNNMFNYGVEFKYNYSEERILLRRYAVVVQPKYLTLKQELINNNLHIVLLKQFNIEMKKALINHNSSYRKHNKKWSCLEIEHVLSLMIYTNFDSLQRIFTKTYYHENYIKRHNEFFHLGKHLKLTIQKFGQNMNKAQILCHGTTQGLNFSRLNNYAGFGVSIYCPLSTTSSMEVAINFTNQNQGRIIQFRDVAASSKYFATNWLSDFPAELEHLFVQNTGFLHIQNIIDVQNNIEYETVLCALDWIQSITTVGNWTDFVNFVNITKEDTICLASAILQHQLSQQQSNEYISMSSLNGDAQQLIDVFFNQKLILVLNFEDEFNSDKSFLYSLLMLNKCDPKWIQLELIRFLFPNVSQLIIYYSTICDQIMVDIMEHLKDTRFDSIDISLGLIKNNTQTIAQRYKTKFDQIGYNITVEEDTVNLNKK